MQDFCNMCCILATSSLALFSLETDKDLEGKTSHCKLHVIAT